MPSPLLKRALPGLVLSGALLLPGTALAVEPDEPGGAEVAADQAEAAEFSIRFPVRGPAEFSDTWGAARSGGRTHKGTDIMAEKMIEVVAVADGVVSRIRDEQHNLGGYYLEIDHGNGWISKYVHLNNDTPGTDDGSASFEQTFAAGLHEGQPVAAGEVIAFVGDSGNAEGAGSHLHFELEFEGSALNPYPFLVEAHARYLEDIAGTSEEQPATGRPV